MLSRTNGSGAERNGHLHDLAIIGGVVVCIVVMVLLSRIAHRALMHAASEPDRDSA